MTRLPQDFDDHPTPDVRAPSVPGRTLRATLKFVLLALAVLAIIIVGQSWHPGGGDELASPEPLPPAARTAVYVWQRQWTDAVGDAVGRIARQDVTLMVLAGEVTAGDGGLSCSPVQVDWPALARAGRPVWLVMRADISLAARLADRNDTSPATVVALYARDAARLARATGVHVAGIQLDYDCPTSKLADYAAWLDALRQELPGVSLSITALPTWLADSGFAPLVDNLDHFVLQAHSLEKPETIDRPVTLCDPRKAVAWAEAANEAGTPFYVALPTYGYRLVFDTDGRFVALSAEGPRPVIPPGYRMGVVMANPLAMAPLAAHLKRHRPEYCLGVAWFRLPVAGDALCWPIDSLEAAMAGREPRIEVRAEIRNPSDDLVEVWLSNTGERNVAGKLKLTVRLAKDRRLLAHDLVGGFVDTGERSAAGGWRLAGPAPAVGRSQMIAWFRFHPIDLQGRPATAPVAVTQMEVPE